jgi:molybdate transport system substrate-binding protein
MRALWAVLLALLALPALAQERVLVFAAASLKNAIDEVNAAYTGARVVASYGASSALARQIENGAPAQVFISADLDWMDYLEKQRLLQPGTRRNLLGNRLVLIAPAGTKSGLRIAPGFALAPALGGGRLALANPDAVPAGKYAKAALEKLGVWDEVSRRVAAAENVRAALLLVARGEAPLGVVYETDARSERAVSVLDRFDAALHPPIVYPAALLRGSGAQGAGYLAYLASAQAMALFEKHGFAPLH